MTGLWRVHHALSEALHLFDQQRAREANAYIVQVCEAIHQAALDGGQWETAASLTPTADPLRRPTFGGQEKELYAIHRHQKALKELKQKIWKSKEQLQQERREKLEQQKRAKETSAKKKADKKGGNRDETGDG